MVKKMRRRGGRRRRRNRDMEGEEKQRKENHANLVEREENRVKKERKVAAVKDVAVK